MNSSPPSHQTLAGDEEQQDGLQGAQRGEDLQHLLAQVRVVGDGSQDRQEEHLQQEPISIRSTGKKESGAIGMPAKPRHAIGDCLRGVRRQRRHVRSQEYRADGGAEGRVGPVVHGPPEDLPLVVHWKRCLSHLPSVGHGLYLLTPPERAVAVSAACSEHAACPVRGVWPRSNAGPTGPDLVLDLQGMLSHIM